MSTPNFFVEEHHILTALFDEGLEMVHLDKPNSEPVFCERLLSLLPESYRRLIVTHDHFYLQNEYELKGIHLSERNPQVPAGYKGSVSCSCDSLDSLSQAKKDRDHVLFEVTDIDLSTLKDASKRKLIDKKVFATGDIDLDNVSQIADCGFGGVVLQEAIWKRFDIHNTQDFKEIINYFRKVRRAVD